MKTFNLKILEWFAAAIAAITDQDIAASEPKRKVAGSTRVASLNADSKRLWALFYKLRCEYNAKCEMAAKEETASKQQMQEISQLKVRRLLVEHMFFGELHANFLPMVDDMRVYVGPKFEVFTVPALPPEMVMAYVVGISCPADIEALFGMREPLQKHAEA